MNTQSESGAGRPTPANRRRREALLWLSLVAILLLALPLFAPQPAPRASYTRYVSPPLPDGTRFTFLYPSDLALEKNARMPTGSSVQFSTPSPTLASSNFLLTEAAILRDTQPREAVSVMVMPRKGWKSYPKMNLMNFPKMNLRRDYQRVEQYRLLSLLHKVGNHGLDLYDARTQTWFLLDYSGTIKSGHYAAHNAAVIQSFRILPPGTSAGPPSLP